MTTEDGAALAERFAAVRRRVGDAAARSGRDASRVTVVAVTKTVEVGAILALARLGQRDFGENRPQDLVRKRSEFASRAAEDPELAAGRVAASCRWHLIGHLQRNKVRSVLPAADVVHSLDSLRLAESVAAEVARAGRAPVPCLLQVNVSGEATKGGFAPAEVRDAARAIGALPGIRVAGMMTMAPWGADPACVRRVFRGLRELRDAAASSGYLSASELSMGMSEDFEVAVEEGATIVRIGRALVGGASG